MKTTSTLIVLLLTLFLSAAAQTPKTAEDYNNRGLERQAKGDIAGAIEDYTAAIARKGRADFEKAFKIDPSLRPQYGEFIEKRHLKIGP